MRGNSLGKIVIVRQMLITDTTTITMYLVQQGCAELSESHVQSPCHSIEFRVGGIAQPKHGETHFCKYVCWQGAAK